MTRANVVSKPKKETTGACGCKEVATVDTCCELECFERPSYFCGHLLTDADLNQEQRYFLGKNKLYHRSLHGDGVVCGLRLTCDPDCEGSIRVGEGYAIDDCGHDLVVCEPARFDVLTALKKKGWLVPKPPPDPCDPKGEEPECEIRQCFHVVACYREEPDDFEAPQAAGCRPDLSGCEPTRIRETVCFDLLDELPADAGPLGDLEARIKACFKLFSQGAFAAALEKELELLTAIAGGGAEPGKHQVYFDLFCKLRGLFLLYLDKHPDRYNCRLESEVRQAAFPKAPYRGDKPDKDAAGTPAGVPAKDYARQVADAFCHLLGLAWRYAVSCALGELVPPCREPAKASCVVLGTVEVVNGCLVRVCNCPRDYVWSFAHLFEVLLATLGASLSCKSQEGETCCREHPFDCKALLALLAQDRRWAEKAATAPFTAFANLGDSMRYGFDLTRTDAFSPGIFLNRSVREVQVAAEQLGLQVRFEEGGASPLPFAISEVLQTFGLQTREEPIVVTERDGFAVAAHTWRAPEAMLAPEERQALEADIAKAEGIAAQAERKTTALATQLETARKELTVLRADLDRILASQDVIVTPGGPQTPVTPVTPERPQITEAARCAATTRTGERCKLAALPGSRFCQVHKGLEGPQDDEG